MSINVTNAAVEQSKASGVARLVLLCLASHASDKGEAWPSRETIMQWANASESAVKNGLRWLRENGEIRVLRDGGGRAKSTRYLVSVGVSDGKTGQNIPGKDKPVTLEKGSDKNRFNPERGQILPVKGSEYDPDTSGTVKSSSSARENEWDDDRLLDEVTAAVGLTNGRLPTHWMPPAATMHVGRWRRELKLDAKQIVEAAKASRANHSEPPRGPKALDGVMQRIAAQLTAEPLRPAARKPGAPGSTETAEQRIARWARVGT